MMRRKRLALARAPAMLVFGLVVCIAPAAPAAAADQATPPGAGAPAAPAEAAAPPPPLAAEADALEEITVKAPEPRYVAPTRRDSIGRVWAPVYINGRGPFRLVLDSGASRSGVTAGVAAALDLQPDKTAEVRVRGVTGSAVVSTIRVDELKVGDVYMKGSRLPIIADALGGAEGVLGNEGLADRRVLIDFRNDLISIARSHGQHAAPGFKTIPFVLEQGRLMIAHVQIGSVTCKAIIDTGGQVTVGNLALRDALRHWHRKDPGTANTIEGVTEDVQSVESRAAPPIQFGPIEIRTQRMLFADTRIFEYWHLTSEPVLLIGMDVLGLLDTLIIDYRREELQLRMRWNP